VQIKIIHCSKHNLNPRLLREPKPGLFLNVIEMSVDSKVAAARPRGARG
jgi:hypothetical protein